MTVVFDYRDSLNFIVVLNGQIWIDWCPYYIGICPEFWNWEHWN